MVEPHDHFTGTMRYNTEWMLDRYRNLLQSIVLLVEHASQNRGIPSRRHGEHVTRRLLLRIHGRHDYSRVDVYSVDRA
jgi:hypothetical protein